MAPSSRTVRKNILDEDSHLALLLQLHLFYQDDDHDDHDQGDDDDDYENDDDITDNADNDDDDDIDKTLTLPPTMAIPRGLPASLGNSIIFIFRIVVLIIIKIVIIIIGSSSSDDCKDQPINHHPPHWPPTYFGHCR